MKHHSDCVLCIMCFFQSRGLSFLKGSSSEFTNLFMYLSLYIHYIIYVMHIVLNHYKFYYVSFVYIGSLVGNIRVI